MTTPPPDIAQAVSLTVIAHTPTPRSSTRLAQAAPDPPIPIPIPIPTPDPLFRFLDFFRFFSKIQKYEFRTKGPFKVRISY